MRIRSARKSTDFGKRKLLVRYKFQSSLVHIPGTLVILCINLFKCGVLEPYCVDDPKEGPCQCKQQARNDLEKNSQYCSSG